MIPALAVIMGFKREITRRLAGFAGHVRITDVGLAVRRRTPCAARRSSMRWCVRATGRRGASLARCARGSCARTTPCRACCSRAWGPITTGLSSRSASSRASAPHGRFGPYEGRCALRAVRPRSCCSRRATGRRCSSPTRRAGCAATVSACRESTTRAWRRWTACWWSATCATCGASRAGGPARRAAAR